MGISTHVLDTARGAPASGVEVLLSSAKDGGWVERGAGVTDADGRCGKLLTEGAEEGVYRVRFETGAYFERRGEVCLYPHVEIVFAVRDTRHYHIPLLLTANGYTTYRGS